MRHHTWIYKEHLMSGYFWHHKVVQSPCKWFSAAWSWHHCLERLRSIRLSAGMHLTLTWNYIQHFDIALWPAVCTWQRLEKKRKREKIKGKKKTKVKRFGIDIRNRHCFVYIVYFGAHWQTVRTGIIGCPVKNFVLEQIIVRVNCLVNNMNGN